MVADIADVARGVAGRAVRPAGRRELKTSRKAPMQRHEGGYYIRLLGGRRAGHRGGHRERLAEHSISIEIDRAAPSGPQAAAMPPRRRRPVPVILITYATTEDAVRKALAAVQRDRVISGRPQIDPHRKELNIAPADRRVRGM